jgi:prepilin-type N-terminal cleavage/methylation domain-containing protein
VNARGFTLIETLVAIVVLSVGLLGAVALLLASLRGQNDARREVAAVALMRDAADRVRAEALACAGAPPCDVGAIVSRERAALAAATLSHFPRGDVVASLEYAPAIGAAPDRHVITLRLAQAAGTDVLSLRVFARAPVAG